MIERFNNWIQDTQDYSKIKTKEEYIARKSNDAVLYGIKVIGMTPHEAYKFGDAICKLETRRLS